MCGTRIAEGAESQSSNTMCHRPNEGQGSPFRVDREFFSQTVWDIRDMKTRRARKAGRPADQSNHDTCHKGESPKVKGQVSSTDPSQ
ncbi:hypothetical protein KI387_043988 [Taxus chinensis]|uniref:Uncharacterized protein n=1 Tax=Taxus chinensis TaxID=29808 RepID=A0AA38G857_TAXCH|nr:hypothetical protein KI387_043988 [Taxus chinensis]